MNSTKPIYQPNYANERFRSEVEKLIPATPEQVIAQKTASSKRGLGDRVHAVAGPIGRAIHWPCMKGDGTTDLKPGSPCDKARNLLNKIPT